MAKYRKKPVVIEAFKLGVDEMPIWFTDAITTNKVVLYDNDGTFWAHIHTLEGWHYAYVGEYIIRGVKGELYPCKADIFEMTYEPA